MLWRSVAVVLVGLTLLVGCSGDDDEPLAAAGSAETSAPPSTEGTTTTAAPATTADGASGQTTVPDAVGLDLQLAQDTMQAAGFFLLISHDATGQDRFQVVDRNWTVCDQSPPGGTPASADAEIDFGAVKDDETCPAAP
jgi:hypothetical protein